MAANVKANINNRIYPNNEQKVQIEKTFGCCRFVYNQTSAYRKEIYEKEKSQLVKRIVIITVTEN